MNRTSNPPVVPPATQWMQRPEVPGCPPGLEYLTMVDQILAHQAVELLEGTYLCGISTV